jgi:hypothetical protein
MPTPDERAHNAAIVFINFRVVFDQNNTPTR